MSLDFQRRNIRGKMENKVADAFNRRKAGTSVQLVQGVQTAL